MKLNVLLAKLEQGASQFKALLRDYTAFFKLVVIIILDFLILTKLI